MDWELGKQNHLALSALAASTYDDVYEEENFATSTYMKYEISQLRQLVDMAPDRTIAIDLGCGTGRHTFELAKKFDQVFGVDFSPEMIRQAETNKAKRGVGNVSFLVADVEEKIPDLPHGRASLVVCGFGMGSFVKRVSDLFNTVQILLKPSGVAAFSWYNAGALVNQLNLDWQPALAARMSPGGDSLVVTYQGTSIEISAVAYHASDLRNRLERHFSDEIRLTSYPTLTALLPQTLLKDPAAQELCKQVDELLANSVESAAGPYLFALTRKAGAPANDPELVGYARVLELLRRHEIQPHTIAHAPVKTMLDVTSQFPDVPISAMIKSVLVGRTRGGGQDHEHDDLVLALVPSNRQVSFSMLANHLDMPRVKLYMAHSEQMLNRTGFSVGAIPPFGMPKRVQVVLDESLAGQPNLWMGTGKTTETYRMTPSQLRVLSNYTIARISREPNEGASSAHS